MVLEAALELVVGTAVQVATAIPELSLGAYVELRNRQATRVSFDGARRVSIADATEGRAVRILGDVRPTDTGTRRLRAPISDEECLAWSVRLFRREVVWRDIVRLHLVAEGSDSVPLAVVAGDRLAHLAGPLVDLESVPEIFVGRALAEELPAGLGLLLRERGLDAAALADCEVHEHRLTVPARVEVGGIATCRLGPEGFRGARAELWLESLPSGHLPLRTL